MIPTRSTAAISTPLAWTMEHNANSRRIKYNGMAGFTSTSPAMQSRPTTPALLTSSPGQEATGTKSPSTPGLLFCTQPARQGLPNPVEPPFTPEHDYIPWDNARHPAVVHGLLGEHSLMTRQFEVGTYDGVIDPREPDLPILSTGTAWCCPRVCTQTLQPHAPSHDGGICKCWAGNTPGTISSTQSPRQPAVPPPYDQARDEPVG
jgi:hypothetical protein